MPGEKWHALPVEEVLSKLGVSVEEGLSVGEAERRLRSFGFPKASLWISLATEKNSLAHFSKRM